MLTKGANLVIKKTNKATTPTYKTCHMHFA